MTRAVEFTRQAATVEKRLHDSILYHETQEGEQRFEKLSLAAWSVVLQMGSHCSGKFSANVMDSGELPDELCTFLESKAQK
jgi:hypothetical protein